MRDLEISESCSLSSSDYEETNQIKVVAQRFSEKMSYEKLYQLHDKLHLFKKKSKHKFEKI